MHQMIRILASLALLESSTEFAPAAEQGVLVQPEWASAGRTTAEPVLASARVLLGDEPDPSREVAP